MTDSQIKSNIKDCQRKLGDNVLLVAVSKTKPISLIKEAYDSGHRDFGENKVQELAEKFPQLPEDINWHMIGHLQRNKVKHIAPFVYLIHSVDSERLLIEVNKQGKRNNRVISCLLQVHIAKEDAKFGWNEEELKLFLDSGLIDELSNIRILGLMGMATNTNDEAIVAKEFQTINQLFQLVKSSYSLSNVNMKYLSIGMSGDFEIALKNGGNMVRIGTAIFGARNQ